MASRRLPALPKLALAAALGASALATTAAAEQAVTHSADKHSSSAHQAGYGDVTDWNTMVPEGGHPAEAS